jgi:RNA 2',3'-cyclic 3'-phosphodiesterase
LMRAFVALEVPEPMVIDKLVEMQMELKETKADLKLVERENLHFTVKFLGEITQEQANQADSKLSGLALKGVEVEVRGLGAFPNPERPRVVWVGVSREHEGSVAPLAQAVIEALEGVGERDDRPFRAHITLARVRSPRNAQALAGLLRSNADRSFGPTRLAALSLKSSTLTPSGPKYTTVGEYPLL